jgi:hypothetical protein
MIILSKRTILITKWIEVKVRYDRKDWTFSVRTKDGKVDGNYKNSIGTSAISYFNKYSDRIRKKHFEQIKAFVEKKQS